MRYRLLQCLFSFQVVLIFFNYLIITPRVVRVEFSGCMEDVFKLFLRMKIAEAVSVLFPLAVNKIDSNNSKSATADSLTLRPDSSLKFCSSFLKRCDSSSVPLFMSWDSTRLGLHAQSEQFTGCSALSPSSLALIQKSRDSISLILSDSHLIKLTVYNFRTIVRY